MYRAVQKEAAELGANAIVIEGRASDQTIMDFVEARLCKPSQLGGARNIRDVDPTALTPTSTVSTTRDANQVIPSDAPLYPER